MKIQDLEMMEILTIDQAIVDRVRGGFGLSLIEEVIGLADMKIISWKSLHDVLEHGYGTISVFSMIGTSVHHGISFSSSRATISVG
jgi:hypothetical protein